MGVSVFVSLSLGLARFVSLSLSLSLFLLTLFSLVAFLSDARVSDLLPSAFTRKQVWNHPVKVAHEHVRRAADMNVWPVPYQPLSIQARELSTGAQSFVVRVGLSRCSCRSH